MAKKIQTGRTSDPANALPESKRFGGSPEQDAEFDSRPIMDCHVGGVKVRDLPLLSQRMIQYEQTDEGFAEKNANRTGVLDSMIDPLDKQLQQRRDELRSGMDAQAAATPLKALERFNRPGFAQKLLTTKNGALNPDYVPIKNERGDVVTYKGMVYGERPVEDAKARNKAYQDHGNKRLAQVTQAHRKQGGYTDKDAA
jgi:hypothetical protein